MKESTRGALLSGLVFPGLGQLVSGRPFSGVLYMLLTTAGLFVLIYRVIQRAARGINEILPLMAGNDLDFDTLKELLSRDFAGGWQVETISLIGIGACWMIAIVHAYFVGKNIDSRSQRTDNREQRSEDR